MESTIYINTTLRQARAGTTGAGLPEITLTLLAQWLCHIRFFASGEAPVLLSSPAFVLSIKETPTGVALVRTEVSAENEEGDGYDFEFDAVDGVSLRALLGDQPSLELVFEIEWTVDGITERVHMPCTVINAYIRPDDAAPDPGETQTEAWLTARAVRHDIAQTLTEEQKTQACANIGAAESDHTHSIAEVSGLEEELGDKASAEHTHSAATTSAAGFMSATDKAKLDGLGDPVRETVPAVAQVSEINVAGGGAIAVDGDYIDVAIGGGAIVRAWFNVDDSTSPPAAPSTGRLLEINVFSAGSTDNDVATVLASALNADPDLTASVSANIVTVTQPAGALDAPTSTDSGSLLVTVITAGADAYDRLIAIDGSQVTNLLAEHINMGTASRILASLAGGPVGVALTLTQLLDAFIGSTRGSMLVRGASDWQQLAGSGLLRLIAGADPSLITFPGFFIQARYHEKKDTAIVTGTTFASVFSGTITPKLSTSRIICLSMLNIGAATSNMAFVRLVRSGNVVIQGDASGSRTRVTGVHYANQATGVQSIPIIGSDIPNSAAEQTYEIHLASNAAGSVYLGRSATHTDNAQFPLAPCSMLLVEVAV